MSIENARTDSQELPTQRAELSGVELAVSAIAIGNYLIQSGKGERLADQALRTVSGIGFLAYGGYVGSGILLEKLGGADNLRNTFDRFASGFHHVRGRLELMRLS